MPSVRPTFAAVLAAGLLVAARASADCTNCGGRFICVGDSVVKLVQSCGEPLDRQPVGSQLLGTTEKLSYRVSNVLYTYTVRDGEIVRVDQEFITD